MQKWEYSDRRFRVNDGDTESMMEQLQLMGDVGWELVSITPLYKYSEYEEVDSQTFGIHPLQHDGWMLAVFKRTKNA